MCRAAGLSNLDDGRAHLIQDLFCVFRAKPIIGSFLENEQSHQVLSQLPKCLRALATTDTFIIFQYSLGQTRLAELDIAHDSKPRQLVRHVINLPAPIGVFELGHGCC